MSRFFSTKYCQIKSHASSPRGKNNPRSREIEIYKGEQLHTAFIGIKELSRNSEKVLGKFIDANSLRNYVKSNRPFNGFVLKYKDIFVF